MGKGVCGACAKHGRGGDFGNGDVAGGISLRKARIFGRKKAQRIQGEKVARHRAYRRTGDFGRSGAFFALLCGYPDWDLERRDR